MPARLRRTARSFTAVFVAFWVYRLLVAPWIDPSFVLEEQSGASEAEILRVREADLVRLSKYERIFPPGSWELDEPIMLESEGVELLMKDYETLSNGKIKLSQCTMLYLNGDQNGHDPGRVVVLRALEGAVLQFDADLNLRRGKVGKLKSGEMKGPVTIHGTPSKPGADDELFIVTRDVQMNEQKVWSHNSVEFRYGSNKGRGRDMLIDLTPAGGSSPHRRGPNVGGFERIQLLRDVYMSFQPGSTGLFPGDENVQSAVVPLPDPITGRLAAAAPPVEIRCQGPFRFDLAKRTASFRDRVDVRRAMSASVVDQMACDELQIFFGDRARLNGQSPTPDAKNTSAVDTANERRLSLQAERFVATGNLVAVDAPSNQLYVRANRLEYEIQRRSVVVEAAPNHPEANLKWNDSQYGGRSLVVERPNDSALPLVTALGAGWFDIADPDDPSMTLKARWARELKMRPVEGSHRVSLVGDAQTNFAQMGDLHARQIDLWLVQVEKPATQSVAARYRSDDMPAHSNPSRMPATRGQSRIPVTPLRLLAVGSVRFNSPQLTGDTEQLDVQFDPAGTLLPTPPRGSGPRNGSLGGLLGANDSAASRNAPPTSANAANVRSMSATISATVANSAVAAVGDAPTVGVAHSQPQQPQQQRFELHGDSIQVRLASQGEQTDVDFVEIKGQVELTETKTTQLSERPIEIRGDWLQVKNAAAPQQTTVVVTGQRAFIGARGMEMYGDTINLDRGRNLLWINGAGRTVLPPARTAHVQNASAAPPSRTRLTDSLSDAPVQIDFAHGMQFNGKVARYEKQVTVHSRSQTVRPNHPNALETRHRELKTDMVEATLRRPIDFAAEQLGDDAEVETIACRGPVLMTEQTSDNRGLIAVETLSARDLSIWQTTGKIHALGPGTLESTRLGSTDPFASRAAAKPSNSSAQTTDGPVYVRVDYQGQITGNVHQKELVLHDDIRGVYGPLKRWGDKLLLNPERIGAQEVTFGSEKLKVNQVADVIPDTSSLELTAEGNTYVDGQTFSATAHELKYVQGKKQLILKGPGPDAGQGHNEAVLYYQPQPGGPQNELKAGTIFYWPSTNHAEVDKARTLQFFDAGQTASPPSDRRPAG